MDENTEYTEPMMNLFASPVSDVAGTSSIEHVSGTTGGKVF